MFSKLSKQKKEENSEITSIANDSSLSEYPNFEEVSSIFENNEERSGSKIFEGYIDFEKEDDEDHFEKNIEKEKSNKIGEMKGNFSEIYEPEERKENDIFQDYLSFLKQSERAKIDIVNPPNLFDIQEPPIILRILEYESYIDCYSYEREEASTDSPDNENLLSPE